MDAVAQVETLFAQPRTGTNSDALVVAVKAAIAAAPLSALPALRPGQEMDEATRRELMFKVTWAKPEVNVPMLVARLRAAK